MLHAIPKKALVCKRHVLHKTQTYLVQILEVDMGKISKFSHLIRQEIDLTIAAQIQVFQRDNIAHARWHSAELVVAQVQGLYTGLSYTGWEPCQLIAADVESFQNGPPLGNVRQLGYAIFRQIHIAQAYHRKYSARGGFKLILRQVQTNQHF